MPSIHILHLAVETVAIPAKPAEAGYKTLDFWLVRTGGLRLYIREFHSLRLGARSDFYLSELVNAPP